jgi:hypothetical protein
MLAIAIRQAVKLSVIVSRMPLLSNAFLNSFVEAIMKRSCCITLFKLPFLPFGKIVPFVQVSTAIEVVEQQKFIFAI